MKTPAALKENRVVQKLQFLNNNRLKTAKCGAFCKTCLTTNRVVKQVEYLLPIPVWARGILFSAMSWRRSFSKPLQRICHENETFFS
jgi:hypothetical protein